MKYCEYPNCYKPVYGSLNTSRRYCVQHRSAGFNNDISKCRPLDCKKQAKYEVSKINTAYNRFKTNSFISITGRKRRCK